MPFIAFSNNELYKKESLSKFVRCPHCKELHEVAYGDEILKDGTKVPSKMLAYVNCTNGSMYLVGLNGEYIWKEK